MNWNVSGWRLVQAAENAAQVDRKVQGIPSAFLGVRFFSIVRSQRR